MTYPNGFRAAGVRAGLKESGKLDLALVVNDGPDHVAAGVFTTNRVKAHPVVWSTHALANGNVKAVLINSGNANAATAGGFEVTRASAERAAQLLEAAPLEVAVCSTGVIGVPLDEGKVIAGIEAAHARLSENGWGEAAQAILTTDTVEKTATLTGEYTVYGFAKGAGMIAPGLATMIAVVLTDAVIDRDEAQAMVVEATEASFNRIDVDGCMSTNDTVLLLSSGASGVKADPAVFTEQLTGVCQQLARAMIADAEGATHDIHIRVTDASDERAAVAVARAIAASNLFKCAVFGNDPNWGRIISAVGTVDELVAPFDPADLAVSVNGVLVASGGVDAGGGDEVDMTDREVTVEVSLGAGSASASVWTNDLTYDYVEENSAYTT